MLQDLQEIIAIPSVEGEKSQGAPFGKEVRRALDWFVNKAESYGLKAYQNDGYYGYCEIGKGDIISILAHIDVVPAGKGWASDPYKLVNENGILYGRGVADDKGPLVACLHLLKRLKEENVQLHHRIRLIVGCNEESGSLGIKKYAKEEEIPVVSLVPDADFPVINSEKGVFHFNMIVKDNDFIKNNILSLSGGEKANIVPDKCSITIKKDSPLYNKLKSISPLTSELFTHNPIATAIIDNGAHFEDYSINDNDNLIISASGIAGHASTPEICDNAIYKIINLLALFNDDFALISKYLCKKDSLASLGLDKEDEKTGHLTKNIGVVSLKDNKLTFTLDFRLPISVSKDKVLEQFKEKLGYDIQVLEYSHNLYIPKDDILIKTLLNEYSLYTGEKDPKPLQIGGGTYAKELPNAVAFGPTFANRETRIHNTDENIPLVDLIALQEIYYNTIKKLDKIY